MYYTISDGKNGIYSSGQEIILIWPKLIIWNLAFNEQLLWLDTVTFLIRPPSGPTKRGLNCETKQTLKLAVETENKWLNILKCTTSFIRLSLIADRPYCLSSCLKWRIGLIVLVCCLNSGSSLLCSYIVF